MVKTASPISHAAHSFDREVAARLNPIISSSNTADTITQCAQLVDSLGHLLATAEEPDLQVIHLLTGAIASALRFEAEA